jgi:hypothetical protein
MIKARWAWLVIGLILIGLYLNGALRHARLVNTDMTKTDQSAYMDYARSMRESGYTFVGGRNRMPVYPFLQSLLYEPGLSDEAFFARGKQFNIFLSATLLIGLYVLLDRYLPFWPAVNLLLIAAFTVFIFKAAYFQTELLFYFVNLCCFLALTMMLWRPTWRLGMLTGLLLGVAHLTKASVMVGLAIYVSVALAKVVYTSWRRRRSSNLDRGPAWRSLGERLLPIAAVVAVFLVTVSPYIITSKRVFGRYFYNVNSTFYIWYDSWVEAKAGTRAHGDRVGWPDMPPEEIPSMQKYLREHTVAEIGQRFRHGLWVTLREASRAYGYFKYFCLYALFGLLIVAVHARHTIRLLRRFPFLWLWGLAYFGLYLALYAWYVPISFGTRLPLAQFLPLMFAISFVLWRLYAGRLYLPVAKRRIELGTPFAVLVSTWVAYDIYIVLAYKIVTMYGGE